MCGWRFSNEMLFDQIMTMAILVMLSRMAYLFMGVQSLEGKYVSYREQIWIQIFPFLFKSLCVIAILKYKTHLYYIAKNELAPRYILFALLSLTILNITLILTFPLVECSANLTDRGAKIYGLTLQTTYLAFLSGISLYVACKVHKQLTFGTIKEIRQRVFFLEAMVQLIIISRIIVSYTYHLIYENDRSTAWVSSFMFFYFLLDELIPLGVVVYGMYLQVDWGRLRDHNNSMLNNS